MSDQTSHEAAAHEAAALPVMQPTKLVGRDPALAQVYAQLKESKPVLIYGVPGVGKSALAATLASAYAQQPGGVLWLDVHNDTLESLLVRIGRAYNVADVMQADDPLALVGAIASTLTQHKPLIVLDGRIDEQVAAKFITRCADRLSTLLISDEALDGPWEEIELSPLTAEHAVAMFKQEAAIKDAASDSAIAEIVEILGFLPFAIAVGARAMLASKQPPANYANVLKQVAASTGNNPAQIAVTASFAPLNGALQGVVLMMGATPRGEASVELISMISGAPAESVQQAMNILVGLRLVNRSTRYTEPYYHLHPLTYAFAYDRLLTSERLEGLQAKVKETVLEYAEGYSNAPSPESFNKLATEMNTFLAVARLAGSQDDREFGNKLAGLLSNAGSFASERGYVYEILQLRSTGTHEFPAYPREPAASADEEAVDAPNIFSMLDEIDDEDIEEEFDLEEDTDEAADEGGTSPEDFLQGMVGLAEDEPEVPITPTDPLTALRTNLVEARQAGDQTKQAELLRDIGKLQVEQGMHNEAISTFDEALTIYETLDNKQGMLDMLEMLTALMQKTDNAQAAVLNANRGVQIAQELGQDATHMKLLITLGDARQQLGESEDAARQYAQALETARRLSDTENEAVILYKLGYAQLDSGQADQAVKTLEDALMLFKSQGKRDYEGRVLGALGSAYGELARWAEAISYHTSAFHIAREVKDAEEEALQLGSLAYASVQADQLGQAVLRYRQALHLAYESNDRHNIVSTIVDLARLLLKSQRHISVAELLIEDALMYESMDKDLNALRDRISNEKMLALANNVEMIPINGTARIYAENAYKLLDA